MIGEISAEAITCPGRSYSAPAVSATFKMLNCSNGDGICSSAEFADQLVQRCAHNSKQDHPQSSMPSQLSAELDSTSLTRSPQPQPRVPGFCLVSLLDSGSAAVDCTTRSAVRWGIQGHDNWQVLVDTAHTGRARAVSSAPSCIPNRRAQQGCLSL